MSRINEIAKILGCTGSNVCYLLRRGRIKGTRTRAGWVVSDEALQEYLAGPRRQPPPVKKTNFIKDRNSGIGLSWIQKPGKIKTAKELPWYSVSVEKRENLLSLSWWVGIAVPVDAAGQKTLPNSSRKEKKKGMISCARYTGLNWPAGTWTSVSTKTAIPVIPGCAGGKTCRNIMPTLW